MTTEQPKKRRGRPPVLKRCSECEAWKPSGEFGHKYTHCLDCGSKRKPGPTATLVACADCGDRVPKSKLSGAGRCEKCRADRPFLPGGYTADMPEAYAERTKAHQVWQQLNSIERITAEMDARAAKILSLACACCHQRVELLTDETSGLLFCARCYWSVSRVGQCRTHFTRPFDEAKALATKDTPLEPFPEPEPAVAAQPEPSAPRSESSSPSSPALEQESTAETG